MDNKWLSLTKNRIDSLVRMCKEEDMKSNSEKINFSEIAHLLGGCKIEIEKLMVENHLLKMKLIDKNVE